MIHRSIFIQKLIIKKILHLINKFDEITERTNVAPPNQFLQLATLKFDKGKTFKPHKHIWKNLIKMKLLHKNHGLLLKAQLKFICLILTIH